MDESKLIVRESSSLARMPEVRDFVAMGFRHKKLLAGVFLGVVALGVLAAFLMPAYRSEMKLLVKRERLYPVVSAEDKPAMQREGLTEEEINSEVELLKSEGLLRNVVLANGVHNQTSRFSISRFFLRDVDPKERAIGKAVQRLKSGLSAEPSKKSNVILVRYSSSDPKLAHDVLASVWQQYQQRHMEVHRPSGEATFFLEQAEQQRKKLEEAEAKLAAFPRQQGGSVAGGLERDILVQKTGDLKIALQETRSEIAATQKRIIDLKRQLARTPERITTTLRQTDNAQLMQQLKTTLLNLELKRTELLQKYQPTYRLVVEVEEEIKNTKAAIAQAEAAPLRDTTTDRDATHVWMQGELAKAQAELSGLRGRELAMRSSISEFEGKAAELNDSSIAQSELQRNVKMLDESYQLYSRKAEEARIADALDSSKILNVSMVDPPTIPALPVTSPLVFLFGGVLAGLIFGTGSVLIAEYTNRSFRTPDDVRRWLEVAPVAAVPAVEDSNEARRLGIA